MFGVAAGSQVPSGAMGSDTPAPEGWGLVWGQQGELMYMHLHVCVYMCEHVCVYVFICLCVCVYMCIPVCVSRCVCTCVHLCVYMYVCIKHK